MHFGRAAWVLTQLTVSREVRDARVESHGYDSSGQEARHMNRREFLHQTAVVSAGLALPFELRLRGMVADDEWRTFEVRSDIEILKASGVTRIWLPVPGTGATPYQKRASTTFDAGQGRAKLVTDPKTGAMMVAAEYAAGVKPVLSVTSSVATHDYAVDLSRSTRRRTDNVGLARYLIRRRSSPLMASCDRPPRRSPGAQRLTSTRRERSMTGSSRIRIASRACSDAARATFASCLNRRTSAASAQT